MIPYQEILHAMDRIAEGASDATIAAELRDFAPKTEEETAGILDMAHGISDLILKIVIKGMRGG